MFKIIKYVALMRYFRLTEIKHVYFIAETICKCDDFIDENGYGDCQKRDIQFGNFFTCYVDSSSNCKDIINSTSHPNMQVSAEACEDKNESMILLITTKYKF